MKPTPVPSNLSVIIDLETLGTRPDSVITEIAAIAFDRTTLQLVDEIEIRPDIYHQLAKGRHICPATIAWHREQGTLPATGEQGDPRADLAMLKDFFDRHRPHRIWIQGPDFDRPILENFCAEYHFPLPWAFWRTRDTRTVWDLAFPHRKHDPRPHTALADCQATLADLAASLTQLNLQFTDAA